MKLKKKRFFKKSQWILGAFSTFGIAFGAVYSLAKTLPVDSNSTKASKWKLTNQVETTNFSDKEVLKQVNLGDIATGSLSNKPIVTDDGSYVTSFAANSEVNLTTSGIVKLSPFGKPLYAVDITSLEITATGNETFTNNLAGYHVTQVVKNYDDPSIFYALAVNPQVKISGSSLTQLSITNPGVVLGFRDVNNQKFELVTTVILGLPEFPGEDTNGVKVKDFFEKVKIAQPYSESTTDTELTNENSANQNSKAKKFLEEWEAVTNPILGTGNFQGSVISHLYYWNLKNMVYADGAIAIYGSNVLPAFWFYTFQVFDNTDKKPLSGSNDDPDQMVHNKARLYALYKWTNPVNAHLGRTEFVNEFDEESEKVKARTFISLAGLKSYWGSSQTNRFYYPAYLIAGASTTLQKTYDDNGTVEPQSTLASVHVGATNAGYNSTTNNSDLVFHNVGLINGNKAENDISFKNSVGLIVSDTPVSTISTLAKKEVRNKLVTGGDRGDLFENNASRLVSSTTNSSSTQSSQNDNWSQTTANIVYAFDVQVSVPPQKGKSVINAFFLTRDHVYRLGYRLDQSSAPIGSKKQVSTTAELDLTKSLVPPPPTTADNTASFNPRKLSQILVNNNRWYLVFNNETTSSVYTIGLSGGVLSKGKAGDKLFPNGNGSVFVTPSGIFPPNGFKVNALLPLANRFIYSIEDDISTKERIVRLQEQLTENGRFSSNTSLSLSFNKLNGEIPKYEKDSPIWGTVGIQDANYLTRNGYNGLTVNELANNKTRLNDLLVHRPAFPGQKARIIANPNQNSTELPVSFEIEYFNGKMYGNNTIQNTSLNFPNEIVKPLAAQPKWVVPTAVGVSVAAVVLFTSIGLGIGIPMHKNRKIQDKGFVSTFKKVDTLTSAVGSVYKKIITETSAVKKRPQLLKTADKKPASASISKPTVPIKKPINPAKPPVPPKKPG